MNGEAHCPVVVTAALVPLLTADIPTVHRYFQVAIHNVWLFIRTCFPWQVLEHSKTKCDCKKAAEKMLEHGGLVSREKCRMPLRPGG